MKQFHTAALAFAALFNSLLSVGAQPAARPLMIPVPREITNYSYAFILDEQVAIAVPDQPSNQDLFLARMLTDELGDRFGLHLKTERVRTLDGGRPRIVMGAVTNPLVRRYCGTHAISITARDPGPEGYVLQANESVLLVAGSDDPGAFYGLQSLRQLITKHDGSLRVQGVAIRDWPDKPFRGIKLYLPGRQNIPFFKRFVRDFMALHKYNTLIMEMNASMRLDRHPELNTGWIKFAHDTTYSRRNYPPGAPHGVEQNSTHQDIADEDILEKSEVADLARWVSQYHIELIPELPSFTHSYYLLSEHKDLTEVPGEKWPDTYCPSNPKSYQLLFDVYDEYIEVLKPRMIHAGHDELFLPVGLCPRCGNKDIGERYGEDVKKIHDYLAAKGIRMAIWGDMLLQGVRGTGLQKKVAPDGWHYNTPGGMTPEQVQRLIPKDILIFNWFWNEDRAEEQEAHLDDMGFRQIYGNFDPSVKGYDLRKKRSTLLGGAPSAWFATGEFGFGKDLMADFVGCSNILWRGSVIAPKELSGIVQAMLPEMRLRLRGAPPPSQTEPAISPINIAASFNAGPLLPALSVDLSGMMNGGLKFGNVPFDLGGSAQKIAAVVGTDGAGQTALAKEVVVSIGEDATSLLFLHAAARPAANREMFRVLWDTRDTADLLGWYEVVYEDGFTTSIPIRYGVNIQEWNWDKRQSFRDYCYAADPLALGGTENNRITFFAFEWKNPRLGKVIKEVRLRGTAGFRGASPDFINDYGPVIPNNAVILKAISVVKKRA
jgi:hypothetical protein